MAVTRLHAGLCFGLALSSGLISIGASAAKFNVGFQTGFGRFDYTKKLDSILSYRIAQVSVGASHKDFFSTLSYSRNMQDISISEEEDIGSANRYDIDFTFGYRFTPSWSVFAGYKDNETELSLSPGDPEELDNIGLGGLQRDESYQQDGFFIGVGYTKVINKNVFGLSLAYADLDTENQFFSDVADDDDDDDAGDILDSPFDIIDLAGLIDPDLEFDDLTGVQQGVSRGYSFGAHFLSPITENLYFQAQYKINDYEQTIEFLDLEFDADETYESLLVGVVYLF